MAAVHPVTSTLTLSTRTTSELFERTPEPSPQTSNASAQRPLYYPPMRGSSTSQTRDSTAVALRVVCARMNGSPTKKRKAETETEPKGSRKRRRSSTRATSPKLNVSLPLDPPIPTRDEFKQELVRSKPLIVQNFIAHDPWRILVATMLLNKTSGKAATPIFWELMRRWPTAKEMQFAERSTILTLISPLGLQNKRTDRLLELSRLFVTNPPTRKLHCSRQVSRISGEATSSFVAKGFIEHPYPPTHVSHMPGAGRYALDSYRIFCWPGGKDQEWMFVYPHDKELVRYIQWRWATEIGMLWTGSHGLVAPLRDLPDTVYGQIIAHCRELTYYGLPPPA